MIPVLAVLLAILMMLTGLVMLVVGLRGKKVDDHPHCRRCRFDLNHRWPDTTTCPECGHTHTKRRPRQGMRQREPRRVVCAMPVLTIALAMLLAFAGGNLGVNLNKYKPLGWLMWEVRHAPSGAASSAIQEIADRRLALECLSTASLCYRQMLIVRGGLCSAISS